MSIHATLDRLVEEGKLVRYLPAAGQVGRRSLYVTADFRKEIQDARSALHFFGQARCMVALFDDWVLGAEVLVRQKGRGTDATLALLEPPPADIWEMRVLEPKPQARVFLRFFAADILIAFSALNRDWLGAATPRASRRRDKWQEAMYDCEAQWIRIFGGADAFRATEITGYISENAVECT